MDSPKKPPQVNNWFVVADGFMAAGAPDCSMINACTASMQY